MVFIRRDIWGADLIARDEDLLLFVQVKSNPAHISSGIKELSEGPWPETDAVGRWVVYWPPRGKLRDGPEITVVTPPVG